MKRNSCTPINPKKYSCYGLKKIHTRNLTTKKYSCGSKILLFPSPPSTITFLMIRPLLRVETGDVTKCRLFSQAGLCLTGKYLPTRIFMAVLVSILTFVDRRSCTNLQSWPLRPLTQTFLGLRHAFLLLEREAGKNAL